MILLILFLNDSSKNRKCNHFLWQYNTPVGSEVCCWVVFFGPAWVRPSSYYLWGARLYLVREKKSPKCLYDWNLRINTLPETNSQFAPENRSGPKRKWIIFQQLNFRCELLVSRRHISTLIPKTNFQTVSHLISPNAWWFQNMFLFNSWGSCM